MDDCTASVFDGLGGRIDAGGGIIATNEVGGRLVAAEGAIIHVYAVGVGVAVDGQ